LSMYKIRDLIVGTFNSKDNSNRSTIMEIA
jgi:hypothetical protein